MKDSRRRILVASFSVLAIGFLMGGSAAFAQTTGVSGNVLDPQGAYVPGADVTLLNEGTGLERAAVTDEQGRYSFQSVIPGTYTVKAAMTGFKVTEITQLELLVDTPQTLDLVLELGEVNETITVMTQATAVANTVDATIGNSIMNEQIVDLPLESRNVVDLLSVQPGVTQQGYVTGVRSDQTNLTLDGIDVNDQQEGTAFTPVLRMTPDSVQEFRVTVTNPNANQGRSSGGQVSLVTKSGTNDWHGSAYWFHRNTATTANDFFNNRSGIETPKLLRNLFGGSVGGPIVKDKAFFFFNYEGRIDRSESAALRVVPLPDLGNGIVKYRNTAGGITTLTPEDIASIYPASGGINTAAVSLFGNAASSYPANDNGTGDLINTAGHRFKQSTPLDQKTAIARLDFNLTDQHQLSLRGNYQSDVQQFDAAENPLLPYWPGGPVGGRWNHPIGAAVGHTWNINPTLINTFRYGLTRQAFSNQGDSNQNYIWFRDVYYQQCVSLSFTGCGGRTFARTTPLHNITDDVSWIKGDHVLQFGANLRFIRNQRDSYGNAYDSAGSNVGYYENGGEVLVEMFDDIDPGFKRDFQNSIGAVLGRFSEYTANYTFDGSGKLLPSGNPASREFATEEYEFFFEDSWRVRDSLTVNLGIRWGINTPVNETLGFQVQPTTSLGDYFDRRVASAANGIPLNDLIEVDKAGPFYGRPGYYDTDWNNFSPRISAAWSPQFDDGVLRTIFGDSGQSVVRGGFAMTYDRIGSRLAVTFDLNNTVGFTSSSTIGPGQHNVTDSLGPSFTGYDQDLRQLFPIPGDLEFPDMSPANDALDIQSSLDDTLTTPSNYSWNVSLGRELPGGLFIEASYIGRKAKDLLAKRDIMHFNNLVDPDSGQSWYEASRILMENRWADTPIDQIPELPFFANLFPDFYNGYPELNNSTQQAFSIVSRDGDDYIDWTDIQAYLNFEGIYDNMFVHPQFGSFYTWSTIASSDYHALTLTARERLRESLTVDLNYTWAKSMDNASGLQNEAALDSAGLIYNPLNLDLSRSVSDFDTKHIVNANWLWEIPVGRGKAFAADVPGVLDAIVGGWSFNGVFRWNSGRPIDFGFFETGRWSTNWQNSSNVHRIRDPRPNPTKGGDHPNYFSDVEYAYNSFRDNSAGEVGDRNVFRRSSFATIDFGLHKAWRMPYSEGHILVFRWEVFNAGNWQFLGTPNETGVENDPQIGSPPSSWGNIIAIQGAPRVMQFGLRYEF